MSKTLLVVDDSATMRKVFELTFGGEDVTVVTHDGGDSLLARAREVRPAAAIIDVSLGATSGYDVCRALKADDSIPRFPVLLLYSEQNPLDEARARDVGSDGSLVKPFDTQAAIDKVKAILGGASAFAPGPATAPGAARPPAPAPAPVAAPPGPPGPARSPASAGIGSVGAPPGPGTAHKATQAFAPGSAPGMPPLSAQRPAPSPMASKPAPSPEPDIELEMDDEESAPLPTPPRPISAPGPAPAARAAAPAPAVSPAPAPAAASVVASHGAALSAEVQQRVVAMGLTPAQADAVAALTREVVERVVWEVVPQLAETVIREELRRLTAE